jgi:hypothetical protein
MAKQIPLTQGQFAIVDEQDFSWLSTWKWLAQWNPKTSTFYAARKTGSSCAGGIDRRRAILMHREILNCHGDELVDHKDWDTLNNRRENLRVASNSQNMRHSKARKSSTHGFKGVTWFNSPQKWGARIITNSKGRIFLGLAGSKIEAARVYDKAAIREHGEFAVLNFPRDDYGDGN